ncbi:MAG: methyltransferase domain-containing protein, partial [Thaumarchaeota archaeon]|nr:methyltransferase domain-containing protein [Nitrososphaerota archaeon]
TSGQLLKKLSNLFLDDSYFSLLLEAKTFACRVINLSENKFDPTGLEDSMGNMISKFSQAKVSLDDPSLIIYLILTDSQGFFGFSTEFEKEKRLKKPKNHPHELDWKLSRAMINLAGFKEGDTICDPFCGTGTTLLEAESMGINSIGIDFDKKMCDLSKKNLKENQFNSKVFNSDYKYINKIKNKYDGIVTDLPYGRASKTSEPPEKLLRNFVSIIPKKKKLAIMCKKGSEKGLKLIPSKKYEIYRHKSLTRTILVK